MLPGTRLMRYAAGEPLVATHASRPASMAQSAATAIMSAAAFSMAAMRTRIRAGALDL
jgi:hypothetical protein